MARTVACTLTDHDLALQAKRWRALGARAGLERLDVDDGIRIGFRDDHGVEEELRALVVVENSCCSWASWDVLREDGSLVMSARSSGDGIAALHGMFADVVD
jgi:hypothetical protein